MAPDARQGSKSTPAAAAALVEVGYAVPVFPARMSGDMPDGVLHMKRLIAFAIVASTAMLAAQSGQQASIDWPHWGADLAQSKYSAATEITRANVTNLELAWRWQNDEKPIPEFEMRPGAMQSTPIMIDGVVYISTG